MQGSSLCSTGETRRVTLATRPVNINKIVSHLKSLNTNKTTTNDIGAYSSLFEQAHKCCGVKLDKNSYTLPS